MELQLFLDHVVGQDQVKASFAKVQAINDFPVPSSKKQIMLTRFLGMAGYNRTFCNNVSSMSAPLLRKIVSLFGMKLVKIL